MLRIHEFLEWISKTAAMEPSFHSLWVLAFLKRSTPKLKTVFESSLLHKLAVTSHTMVDTTWTLRSWTPTSNSVLASSIRAT